MVNLKLGQILINSGILSERQLQDALTIQKNTHQRLGRILVEKKLITETQMSHSLAEQLDIPYVSLDTFEIDPQLSSLITESFARTNMIIPIRRNGNVLTVALANPLDYSVINDIGTITKMRILPMIAEQSKIEGKIRELFAKQKAQDAVKELAIQVPEKAEEHPEDEKANQPIIKFVNNMIDQAVLIKASDIHIEPQKEALRIRFRVDGHLRTYMETSMEIAPAIVSRIKFIGGMNIAEKRIPQDGRINYKAAGKDIDLRISVLPSIFGEKVVLRITTALGFDLKKQNIGFLPENLEKFDALLHNNHGIILLTGPTGSGKSTTLYTALKEIIRPDINIVTIEDPVEMLIPNITQVEVNEKAGLTFASVLRSILRQDPDVVMVGEIRDRETAEIATSVAITGHLVFSTLHTYDASSSIIRLVDMGVEPYMVSSAVIGVIAQRLVRTLCTHCREEYEADDSELRLLGMEPGQHVTLYKDHEKGCPYCNSSGFSGRMAIHEIMPVTEAIKKCINTNASVDTVRETALREGMIPMEQNLKRIVLEGKTSVAEMVHVSSSKT